MARLLLLGTLLAALLAVGCAFTLEEQFERLVFFRDAMFARSPQWESALESWTCPTPGGGCDPCSDTSFGHWEHMHCRGLSPGKDGDGTVDGWLTNIHISDLRVDGPVPRELCLFRELRELDLDGGRLTGPIPEFLASCFPNLAELDMSFNKVNTFNDAIRVH